MFAGGDFGILAHYNGKDWRTYNEFLEPVISIIYSIAMKGDMVAVSGLGAGSRKAVLLIGKRN